MAKIQSGITGGLFTRHYNTFDYKRYGPRRTAMRNCYLFAKYTLGICRETQTQLHLLTCGHRFFAPLYFSTTARCYSIDNHQHIIRYISRPHRHLTRLPHRHIAQGHRSGVEFQISVGIGLHARHIHALFQRCGIGLIQSLRVAAPASTRNGQQTQRHADKPYGHNQTPTIHIYQCLSIQFFSSGT